MEETIDGWIPGPNKGKRKLGPGYPIRHKSSLPLSSLPSPSRASCKRTEGEEGPTERETKEEDIGREKWRQAVSVLWHIYRRLHLPLPYVFLPVSLPSVGLPFKGILLAIVMRLKKRRSKKRDETRGCGQTRRKLVLGPSTSVSLSRF